MIQASSKNHIAEILKVANGEITKSAYAKLIGVNPSTVTRTIAGDYERAIGKLQDDLYASQNEAGSLKSKLSSLQDDLQKLQDAATESQGRESDLQSSIADLQGQLQNLQNDNDTLQGSLDALQKSKLPLSEQLQSSQNFLHIEQTRLQESEKVNASLKSQLEAASLELAGAVAKIKPLEDFRKEHESWAASNVLEKFLSGGWARLLVLAMLVFYEADVTRQLLIEKGIENPVVISLGIGIAFLVFASSRNIWGQVFIVGYSLFTSGCLFGIFSFDVGYVFLLAFPCIVAAVMKNRQ